MPLCQQSPNLIPDGVSVQELHGGSDQLRFVPLRGVVQRRVAQCGLWDKTTVIQGLGKQQLPLHKVNNQQRDLRENQGMQLKAGEGPEHDLCNMTLLTSFRSLTDHQAPGKRTHGLLNFLLPLAISHNIVQLPLKSPQ